MPNPESVIYALQGRLRILALASQVAEFSLEIRLSNKVAFL